uniref:Uncharacterized protein n=1 Tax=Myoviridae sp. ct2798 TaxID=2827285 RepID=A0A8S5R5D4_9CAUD|nr:MAG TPA: hypothetical protein [Myoviridae sp. ct2798]
MPCLSSLNMLKWQLNSIFICHNLILATKK